MHSGILTGLVTHYVRGSGLGSRGHKSGFSSSPTQKLLHTVLQWSLQPRHFHGGSTNNDIQ